MGCCSAAARDCSGPLNPMTTEEDLETYWRDDPQRHQSLRVLQTTPTEVLKMIGKSLALNDPSDTKHYISVRFRSDGCEIEVKAAKFNTLQKRGTLEEVLEAVALEYFNDLGNVVSKLEEAHLASQTAVIDAQKKQLHVETEIEKINRMRRALSLAAPGSLIQTKLPFESR